MKRYTLGLVLVVLLLIAAACGGSDAGDDTAPAAPTQPAAEATSKPVAVSGTSGSFFAIYEVGLGPEGYISLLNFTDVPVSTAGLTLCQGSDCFALPDVEVAADETARVAVGDGTDLEGVIATQATLGELRPSDGEIAIFAKQDYEDPKAMLAYLQWGSTPHDLTGVAVEAGLWFETSYAPSSANATRLYRVPESGLWLFEE